MSQNDFTIANQTFPNTRADINSALQALASTSSGGSAPSTTFANQFFYNTTSNLLQIRNEDNDAFITIAELDQANDTVEYFKSDSIRTALIEFTDGDDALSIADGGALTVSTSLDMNGTELILDADADTSITASTDDQIDIKIAGADDFAFKANKFEVQTGSNIDMNGQELILDADADTSIHASTDDQIDFKLGGSDKVVLASTLTQFNQNVCVDAYNAVGAGGGIFFRGGFINTQQPSVTVADHNGDSAPDGLSVNGYDGVSFRTANTERGRFDEAGRFLLGATSTFVNGSSSKFQISYVKNSEFGLFIRPSDNNTGGGQPALFQNQAGTSIGSIGATASNISYNTSSDYRLKENVSYSWNATSRLKQLKPARFNWIIDDTNTAIDGFMAHEVTSIVPDAVQGTKDAVETWKEGEELPDGVSVGDNKLDDDGNTIPDYQGIDHSKLVPLLVKTIQELEARITALEG